MSSCWVETTLIYGCRYTLKEIRDSLALTDFRDQDCSYLVKRFQEKGLGADIRLHFVRNSWATDDITVYIINYEQNECGRRLPLPDQPEAEAAIVSAVNALGLRESRPGLFMFSKKIEC